MLQGDQFFVERNVAILTHCPSTTKIGAFPLGGCLIAAGKARPYWNCGTRLPGGETYGQLGLGQGMTSVGLNDLHVVILDPPVGIKVVTEVSAGDRLTHLALDLSLVGLFDCSIGVGVTG